MNFTSEKLKKIKPSGIRELFAKSQGIENVISLGIGAPDIHVPDELKEALKQAVDENFNSYGQTPGYLELREAITKKYKLDYGVDYNTNDGVIITCGGVQLIYMALQTYLSRGDEVLVQDPCFLTYPRQVTLAGGKTVWMPSTDNFEIDIEKTKELVTDKTKVLMLNFPSNPTGAVMSREELKAMVDIAVDNDLLILSDEVYEYYTFDNAKHVHVGSIDGAYERTITINSFSKTYAVPGWRMGYGVATSELMKPIVGYHGFVVANATTPTQVALANFMHTPAATEFKKNVKRIFQKRRDIIVDGLNSIDGISCQKPVGSFYCYPDISQTKYPDGESFSSKSFDESRVVLVPGTEFGPSQKNYVRASFGSANVTQLEEVVERLTSLTD
ncbi:MAG: pyridoxal phosphate-dependent aminotransferase [Candidatus Heimdallarchaeaceae archaeon]